MTGQNYIKPKPSWAEVLNNGNLSGGTNPTISDGDRIEAENGNSFYDPRYNGTNNRSSLSDVAFINNGGTFNSNNLHLQGRTSIGGGTNFTGLSDYSLTVYSKMYSHYALNIGTTGYGALPGISMAENTYIRIGTRTNFGDDLSNNQTKLESRANGFVVRNNVANLFYDVARFGTFLGGSFSKDNFSRITGNIEEVSAGDPESNTWGFLNSAYFNGVDKLYKESYLNHVVTDNSTGESEVTLNIGSVEGVGGVDVFKAYDDGDLELINNLIMTSDTGKRVSLTLIEVGGAGTGNFAFKGTEIV